MSHAFSLTKVTTMLLFPSFLILSVVAASHAETLATGDVQNTCSVIACGSPGLNGFPGKDGHDGAKGEKGEPGMHCPISLILYILQETD